MPYEWITPAPDRPAELHLWPHRSLPRKGFVIFIAVTAIFLAVPLAAVLGTALLWGLLPFMVIAVGGMWWALSRSYRDGQMIEVLTLAPDRLDLVRRAPDGSEKRWSANPYWTRLRAYEESGPVPHYLTLKAEGREVEIGAFLSEDERRALEFELRDRLARLHP